LNYTVELIDIPSTVLILPSPVRPFMRQDMLNFSDHTPCNSLLSAISWCKLFGTLHYRPCG